MILKIGKALSLLLEQEIRRAVTHGFNNAEFSEVKANLLNAYEQADRSSASRKSRALADSLTRSISMGKVFSSPNQDLEWIKENISKINKTTCYEALKKAWEVKDRQIFIGGNIQLTKADNKILEVYKNLDVAPLKEEIQSELLIKVGEAGQIVERLKMKN